MIFHGRYDPKCLKALHNTVHWKRRIRVTAIEGSNPREMTQGDATAAEAMRSATGFRPGLKSGRDVEEDKGKQAYAEWVASMAGGASTGSNAEAPEKKAKKTYVHWSEQADMADAAAAFRARDRTLRNFKPKKKVDNKVVCVKCVLHALGLCAACTRAKTDQRKYLRHLSVEEARVCTRRLTLH